MADKSSAESETPTAPPESGEAPATGASDSPSTTDEKPDGGSEGSGTPSVTPDDETRRLDALKGDLAKERDRRQRAEQDLARLKAEQERTSLITKIAQEQNLPLVLAERLQGATEAELKADAERLLKGLPAPSAPPPPTPVGGPQGTPSTERTPEDWVKFLRTTR